MFFLLLDLEIHFFKNNKDIKKNLLFSKFLLHFFCCCLDMKTKYKAILKFKRDDE